jgi:membrane-bound metal-dependent hydrolase YbcI (DUF457 family)
MPSPLGHFLGGIAAAGLTGASLSTLPDIDFLFGTHSTYTHSLGAVAVVALLAYAWSRQAGEALATSMAYASHLLLDWMGDDTTPPIGIMALWPLTDAFYQSDLHWFMAISRRYWLPGFWIHNLTAVAREILVIGPIAGLVFLWMRKQSRTA